MGTHQVPQSEEASTSSISDKKIEASQEYVLADLPVELLARVLCRLPLRQVVKAACVCHSFRAASNYVWVGTGLSHLPCKYKKFLALDPVVAQFASTRNLFDYLCAHPVFFANNTQVLQLYQLSRP